MSRLHSLIRAATVPAAGGGTDPNPKSLVFCCGFECGRVGSGFDTAAAHIGDAAAWMTISTSTVRTGARSFRFNPAGNNGNTPIQAAGVGAMKVVRKYLRFATLPNVDTPLFTGRNNANAIGLFYKASDQKLYCGLRTSPPTLGATGVSVTTGVQYRIDLKINQTSGARAVDAKVDGVDLGQYTDSTATSPDYLYYNCFNDAGVSGDWFYDDVAVSDTSGDYPIGAGRVEAFVPVSDGTHNIAGADQWERGNTGTDITNGTTDAYQLVDDIPMPSFNPGLTDAIRATAPANATDYVEVVFGPVGSTPTVGPRGVEVAACIQSSVSGAANYKVALVDNGSVGTVFDSTENLGTGEIMRRGHFTNPPSAASAWTTETGDGDFNAVRARMYSSDADPDVYFDALMIEAEFSD